jgi:hypothetical protein
MTQNKLEQFIGRTIREIVTQWERDIEQQSLSEGEQGGYQDQIYDCAMDMEAQAKEVLNSGDEDRIRRYIRGLLCDWENPYKETMNRLGKENHDLSIQLHNMEASQCLTMQMQ